jgi:4'-phosphopantetheinyl transferase
MPSEKYENSKIGYSLYVENSLCGMAMCQGPTRKVVNIGLGIKQMLIHPPGATASQYAESLAHKVRRHSFLLFGFLRRI